MNKQLNGVRQFMESMDQPVRHSPVSQLSINETMLRLHLIREEFNELREALGVHEDEFGWHMDEVRKPLNPAKLLDALSDICYVVYGCYHTLGLAPVAEAGFNEVQASNMTKVGPDGKCIKALNGKVLKGPNYRRPDFSTILESFSKLTGAEIYK